MEISNELVFNLLVDLKKKDVNPIDRADIIVKYLKEKDISVRELARELGMSHSTLQDWLDYNRVDKVTYTKLLDSGYSKKNVYRMLRSTRGAKVEVFESITKIPLNAILRDAEMNIKEHVNDPVFDEKTVDLIKDLRNTLNRLEMYIEKKQKKGVMR